MSSSKSLNKTTRLAERRRLRNRAIRRGLKTRMDRVGKLIGAREESAYRETVGAISSIDKAVSKGVFHRNKGARLKSRLAKRLNATVVVSQGPEREQPAESAQQLAEN